MPHHQHVPPTDSKVGTATELLHIQDCITWGTIKVLHYYTEASPSYSLAALFPGFYIVVSD